MANQMGVRVRQKTTYSDFQGAVVSWNENGKQNIKKYSFYNARTKSLYSASRIDEIMEEATNYFQKQKRRIALEKITTEKKRVGITYAIDDDLVTPLGLPGVALTFDVSRYGNKRVSISQNGKKWSVGHLGFSDAEKLFDDILLKFCTKNFINYDDLAHLRLNKNTYIKLLAEYHNSLSPESKQIYFLKEDRLYYDRNLKKGHASGYPGLTFVVRILKTNGSKGNPFRISPTIFLRKSEGSKVKAGRSFCFSGYENMLERWPDVINEYSRLTGIEITKKLLKSYPKRYQWNSMIKDAKSVMLNKTQSL